MSARAGTKPGTKSGTKSGTKPDVKRAASPAVKAATPWGTTLVLEELQVAQRAGDRRFSSLVQLLEGAKGELLVRFAYSTDGVVRRGPVTLRERDLERFRSALQSCPRLAEALGLTAQPHATAQPPGTNEPGGDA
jgi:hypothetical protein